MPSPNCLIASRWAEICDEYSLTATSSTPISLCVSTSAGTSTTKQSSVTSLVYSACWTCPNETLEPAYGPSTTEMTAALYLYQKSNAVPNSRRPQHDSTSVNSTASTLTRRTMAPGGISSAS